MIALSPLYPQLNKRLVSGFHRRAIKNNYTGSAEILQQIHHWVTVCINAHETCRKRTEGATWRPKRLISIDPNDQETWWLDIESDNHGRRTPYVTLSYCWGE